MVCEPSSLSTILYVTSFAVSHSGETGDLGRAGKGCLAAAELDADGDKTNLALILAGQLVAAGSRTVTTVRRASASAEYE